MAHTQSTQRFLPETLNREKLSYFMEMVDTTNHVFLVEHKTNMDMINVIFKPVK